MADQPSAALVEAQAAKSPDSLEAEVGGSESFFQSRVEVAFAAWGTPLVAAVAVAGVGAADSSYRDADSEVVQSHSSAAVEAVRWGGRAETASDSKTDFSTGGRRSLGSLAGISHLGHSLSSAAGAPCRRPWISTSTASETENGPGYGAGVNLGWTVH